MQSGTVCELREVVLRDKRVRQPSWRRTFVAPTLQWGDKAHVYPLEVLSNILGGGASSRLYRRLVVESKQAVSAGTYYGGDNRGPGRFVFYASPRGATTMDNLQDAVVAEIADILKSGVTDEEVRLAKDRMLAEAVYARDSLSGGARALGAALASGMTIDDVEEWPERIARVTPAQIQAAAKALFDNNRSVTGLLLPAKGS